MDSTYTASSPALIKQSFPFEAMPSMTQLFVSPFSDLGGGSFLRFAGLHITDSPFPLFLRSGL